MLVLVVPQSISMHLGTKVTLAFSLIVNLIPIMEQDIQSYTRSYVLTRCAPI